MDCLLSRTSLSQLGVKLQRLMTLFFFSDVRIHMVLRGRRSSRTKWACVGVTPSSTTVRAYLFFPSIVLWTLAHSIINNRIFTFSSFSRCSPYLSIPSHSDYSLHSCAPCHHGVYDDSLSSHPTNTKYPGSRICPKGLNPAEVISEMKLGLAAEWTFLFSKPGQLWRQ
jgi:hypothetical protein